MRGWTEATAVLDEAGVPYPSRGMERFLAAFDHPADVARGVAAFVREGTAPDAGRPLDPHGLSRDAFLLHNFGLLRDIQEGSLLRFPDGSPVFRLAARTIPWIVAAQVEAIFPGLPTILGRIQPGVDPATPLLDLVEDLVFEDVKTGVMGATTGVYHLKLSGRGAARRYVLKRTDMAIERAVAEMLADVFGMDTVEVLWTSPGYSVMTPVAGVSLRDLSGNPLTEPRRHRWTPADVARVARALGEEAALAEHCWLYSRHSGNVLADRPEGLAESSFVRIDFGQALLPTREPYIEAVMPLWHLRRFFPGDGNDGYENPDIYRSVAAGYIHVAERARRATVRIREHLEQAVGLPLPEMAAESRNPVVEAGHVAALLQALDRPPSPEEAFQRLYNRFYLDFWQVAGWQEYRPPRDRAFEWNGIEYEDLLTPRRWE
jgi:hypothetical protein